MGFSRQEHWSGLPVPSPGSLPNTGIEPRSPTLQAASSPFEPPDKAKWLPLILSSVSSFFGMSLRPLHHRELEGKSKKSKDTWSWPLSSKRSREKVNIVLPRECTGHSKHSLPTTQGIALHMNITRCSILKSDWLYSLQLKIEKLYIVSKNKSRRWLWLRLLTAYCKICTGDREQDPPQEKEKCKKEKWLPEEALQIAVKRREAKCKGERKYIPIWMQSSKE